MATKKTPKKAVKKVAPVAESTFEQELKLATTALDPETGAAVPLPVSQVKEPIVAAPAPEEEVKPKKAEPKSRKDELIAALIEVMPEMGSAIGLALAKGQADAKQAELMAMNAHRVTGEKCQVCQQILPVGCKQGEHKHRLVAVYPSQRRNGKWFMGIRINSVRYLSNNGSHKIPVPADAPIEQMVQMWEAMEDENLTGREVMHDAGSIGPGGQNFHQADARHGFSALG